MVARTRLAIPFNYDENWIGGTYYIKNLISALGLVEESRQPDIFVVSHTEESFDFIREGTGYKRLSWITPAELNTPLKPTRLQRILRRGKRHLNPKFDRFDVVFPYDIYGYEDRTVCWIPDFQEKHLPHFFSDEEIARREAQHRQFFKSYKRIVFSSRSVLDDFRKFYPGQSILAEVVNFAVFHEESAGNLEAARRRLALPDRFFYCPNQFWVHKNHAVIIEALAKLRADGCRPFVAFSGKEFDSRAPGYTEQLKQRVVDFGLEDQVAFLGFLPRDEQMALMGGAIAIIQPSLSEGWSTVIEDAKSLGQFVFASELPVHREQLTENCAFFPPHDGQALAALLSRYSDNDPPKVPFDYDHCQRTFANAFLDVMGRVVGDGR